MRLPFAAAPLVLQLNGVSLPSAAPYAFSPLCSVTARSLLKDERWEARRQPRGAAGRLISGCGKNFFVEGAWGLPWKLQSPSLEVVKGCAAAALRDAGLW